MFFYYLIVSFDLLIFFFIGSVYFAAKMPATTGFKVETK